MTHDYQTNTDHHGDREQIIDAHDGPETDMVTFSDVNANGRGLLTRYITITSNVVVSVEEYR